MLQCLRLKFGQNVQLRISLQKTNGSILIGGNDWHDNNWGSCNCLQCEGLNSENKLGKYLMQIRSDFNQYFPVFF